MSADWPTIVPSDVGEGQAPRVRMSSLRVAYVGPNMDLAEAAYRGSHRALSHQVEYYPSPDHLPAAPAPDVVVIAPLVTRDGRVEGPCLVSQLMPPTTLIVALGTAEGSSHAMWIKHAVDGRCHPRILVHYPTPGFSASDFVTKIDRAARKPGGVAESMAGIPNHLDLPAATLDLGQIMDDPAMGEFLYVAATNPDWSTWNELGAELNLVDGTLKNRMSAFGRTAADHGLIAARTSSKRRFRVGQFVRYVVEHRSFIRAYVQHLDIETWQPPDGDRVASVWL